MISHVNNDILRHIRSVLQSISLQKDKDIEVFIHHYDTKPEKVSLKSKLAVIICIESIFVPRQIYCLKLFMNAVGSLRVLKT